MKSQNFDDDGRRRASIAKSLPSSCNPTSDQFEGRLDLLNYHPVIIRGVYSSTTFDYSPPPAFDFLLRDILRRITKSMFFFPINH